MNGNDKPGFEELVERTKNEMIPFFKKNRKESLLIGAEDIEEYTREFNKIYPFKPVENNVGGVDVIPLYWLFVIVKYLNPSLIVESGVWKGQSSWMMKQAQPNAEIHAFDVNLGNLVRREENIVYHEQDWMKFKTRNRDPNRGFVFFDDHINQCMRVSEAYERGFEWLVFDDNVPVDRIHCIGLPALPSIGMLFDPSLKQGDIIPWELYGKKYSYVFSEKDTYGARDLIDYHLVFPTFTCVTLVRLKCLRRPKTARGATPFSRKGFWTSISF